MRPWEPTVEPASVERMAFPLPDKPSIAVLPLDNMSGDPEREYFADGMTEDLAVSPMASFGYRWIKVGVEHRLAVIF